MSYIAFPAFDNLTFGRRKTAKRIGVKTAGILGGMAAQSTTLFYHTATQYCLKKQLPAFPRFILNSVNGHEVVELLRQKDMTGLFMFLNKEIEKIQGEIDLLVMVCNSIHAVLNPIRRSLHIPVLSIFEEVCKEVALSNIKKVGLIGTQTTIEHQFYQHELDRYGIEYAITSPEHCMAIDQCVFKEIVIGKNTGRMKQLLVEGIQQLEAQGCEAVILGCTELPLFMTQKDTDMRLFLSTQLLAEAVVERCTNKSSLAESKA